MSAGLTYKELKNELFMSLEQQLCMSVANLTQKSFLTDVDVYKITVQSYRKVNQLLQVYSDSVVEMIASSYDYRPETFYILDVKFLIWKVWLETVLALSRFYTIDPSINGSYRNTIKALALKAKSLYESTILNEAEGLDVDFIKAFTELHEDTFNTFFKQIDSALNEWDGSNNIKSLADLVNTLSHLIIFWMQYTVFEVLSLDRCYNTDKPTVIVSGVVVEAANKGVNLVDNITKVLELNDKVITIRYTHPDLMNFSYLFERYQK